MVVDLNTTFMRTTPTNQTNWILSCFRVVCIVCIRPEIKSWTLFHMSRLYILYIELAESLTLAIAIYTSGKIKFLQNEGGIGIAWSTKKEERRGHYTAKMHKANSLVHETPPAYPNLHCRPTRMPLNPHCLSSLSVPTQSRPTTYPRFGLKIDLYGYTYGTLLMGNMLIIM